LKIYSIIGFFFLAASGAWGQFRPLAIRTGSELSYLAADKGPSLFGRWRSDQQINAKYPSPRLTISPVNANGSSYWLGSTTTQSFNNGKFGTVYYYDMMGNMQYARTFIDIAGKNKRGLKLMLPTLNQRMFMQR
jgi:hypothetical protein